MNKPLFVPVGVRLVPLTNDELNAPIERVVITCEGSCRPSWTGHKRISLGEIAGGNMQSAPSAVTASSPIRYQCEHYGSSRRFGV